MIKQILADLVRIDSVSTRSNAEIVAYLEQRCEALGLITRRFPYTDDFSVEKINLIALTHDVPEVELALVGHTDTVPYDPNWSEATTSATSPAISRESLSSPPFSPLGEYRKGPVP